MAHGLTGARAKGAPPSGRAASAPSAAKATASRRAEAFRCGRFSIAPTASQNPSRRLPLRAIRKDDGWCDAPDDPNYNRLVKLPYPASAETMWREDHLYDLVAVLGYNDDPVVPGKGSAIFLHLARDGLFRHPGLRRAARSRCAGGDCAASSRAIRCVIVA